MLSESDAVESESIRSEGCLFWPGNLVRDEISIAKSARIMANTIANTINNNFDLRILMR